MGDLLKDLDRIYTGLQNLNVQPTKNNTAIILDTLQVLEVVYQYLQNEQTKTKEDANAADSND